MRPSSDIEVTTAVLHKVRKMDHEWSVGCCGAEPHDRLEAEDLVAALAEFGAHVAFDVAMPTEVRAGRDGVLKLTDFIEGVLMCLDRGPLSTHELNTLYQQRSDWSSAVYPPRSFDTPRKRLSELDAAGLVRQVMDGDKQLLRRHHGVGYGVWEITDKGRAAVSRDGQAAAA